MKKVALITGISGQDGSYLADLLLAKEKLGWTPKTSVDELINMMVDYDFDLGRKEFVISVYDREHKYS